MSQCWFQHIRLACSAPRSTCYAVIPSLILYAVDCLDRMHHLGHTRVGNLVLVTQRLGADISTAWSAMWTDCQVLADTSCFFALNDALSFLPNRTRVLALLNDRSFCGLQLVYRTASKNTYYVNEPIWRNWSRNRAEIGLDCREHKTSWSQLQQRRRRLPCTQQSTMVTALWEEFCPVDWHTQQSHHLMSSSVSLPYQYTMFWEPLLSTNWQRPFSKAMHLPYLVCKDTSPLQNFLVSNIHSRDLQEDIVLKGELYVDRIALLHLIYSWRGALTADIRKMLWFSYVSLSYDNMQTNRVSKLIPRSKLQNLCLTATLESYVLFYVQVICRQTLPSLSTHPQASQWLLGRMGSRVWWRVGALL